MCGWARDALLRLIVIDSFKILEGSKKIIKSIIEETKYSETQKKLFMSAEFDNKIRLLKILIKPWKPHRNKKYAHMENKQLRVESLDLIVLADSLKNLKSSIGFIMHYLSNPRYIPLMGMRDVALYTIQDEESSESLFNEQMKNDRVIRKINQMIENLLNRRKVGTGQAS